jgi:hypothetical protein
MSTKLSVEEVDEIISNHLQRMHDAEDVLRLTVARRLNRLSDRDFAQALGGPSDLLNDLNLFGKRRA